jgi:hypothetical protein
MTRGNLLLGLAGIALLLVVLGALLAERTSSAWCWACG